MISKLKYWLALRQFSKWVAKVELREFRISHEILKIRRQQRYYDKLIQETCGVPDYMRGGNEPRKETATESLMRRGLGK